MRDLKSDTERLADAMEIIRKKNLEITDANRRIRTLEHEEDTAEKIRKEIWGLAEHNPDPPAWISGRGGIIGKRGCPLTVCSDIHYGETVSKDETNGVNEFNKDIAKKRLQRYFNTVVDLSYNHMGRAKTEYPGIILMLGGDMIGGDIHEELLATNDRTPQQSVNDLTDILAAGIDHLAGSFGKIYCPAVVGNHGRNTKKMRMKQRVFTNFDWSIYCNLARHFKQSRFVHIDVPNTADAHFRSFGVRYMLSHGDSLGVKGGDGIIGAIGPILRGSIKLGQQTHKIGLDFDELVLCHWHQCLFLPGVTVNNALKGTDEYAMLQLRAPATRPSQSLWFNHPEHGTTARWEIFLEKKPTAKEGKQWVAWQE
jgi:hypothetical protein